jgi:hypothetical protein
VADTIITVLAIFLLFGIVCVTVYGWRIVPPDTRFRSRFGFGYDGSMSKKVGLLTWPVLAFLVTLGTVFSLGPVGWLGLVVLLWILVMEIVAINTVVARREG